MINITISRYVVIVINSSYMLPDILKCQLKQYVTAVTHLLRVCQWTERLGPNAWSPRQSVRLGGRWWWSVSGCPCRQWWTDPWNREKEQFMSLRRLKSHKGAVSEGRKVPLSLTVAPLFVLFIEPTCRRCPRPPSGHRNLWRWCAVCQIPGESSWYPDRPAYVVC